MEAAQHIEPGEGVERRIGGGACGDQAAIAEHVERGDHRIGRRRRAFEPAAEAVGIAGLAQPGQQFGRRQHQAGARDGGDTGGQADIDRALIEGKEGKRKGTFGRQFVLSRLVRKMTKS